MDSIDERTHADTEAAATPDQGASAVMGALPVEDWDYQQPRRGQVRPGVILSIGEQQIIVDVDAKRDGIVPFADMQRLGAEALSKLSVGDRVWVYILQPEDQDGNLLVSLFQARQAQAWQRASELADSGEAWEGTVAGYNKGGLVVPLDDLRGFVPSSQIPGFPHNLSQEERLRRLAAMVGERLWVKVIEINRQNRRLILSATAAQREQRTLQREKLLEDLREGEVRRGVVSSLCSFGAFVDLGGADGLVHLSELSWKRVRHPREVVRVGDEVEVYVLRLDEEEQRIGLSLKRLQPEPWALVEDKYELGQLVEGVITNVTDFGAFAQIDEGIEGLIHISELTDQATTNPREVVRRGQPVLLRIVRIDLRRKRLGLSMKRVLESERAEWEARVALTRPPRAAERRARPRPQGEPEGPAGEETITQALMGEDEVTAEIAGTEEAAAEVAAAEFEETEAEAEAAEFEEAAAEVEAAEFEEAAAEVEAAEFEEAAAEVEAAEFEEAAAAVEAAEIENAAADVAGAEFETAEETAEAAEQGETEGPDLWTDFEGEEQT